MKLSSIVVGDDRSAGSTAAHRWADEIATAAGALLVIAQELDPPSAPALLAFADEVDADLVVVGRRGAGGFDDLRLGSTAHQVAEHATRPVAVVPAPSAPWSGWPLATIVVGHDGSTASAGALAWIAPLAAEVKATVVVVHALELAPAFAAAGLQDEYESARARAAALADGWSGPLRDAGVDCSTVVEEGGPAGVLLDVVRTNAADLMVVGRRSSGSFPGMTMGSVAHRALGFAPCPVVVVPEG